MPAPTIAQQNSAIATNSVVFTVNLSHAFLVGDVVEVVIGDDSGVGAAGVTCPGVPSAGPGSFSRRGSGTDGSAFPFACMTRFVGTVTTAQAGGGNVTVTMNGVYDDAVAAATVYRSTYPSNPFDANAGLPVVQGGAAPCDYSTLNDLDLLVCWFTGPFIDWPAPPPQAVNDPAWSWQLGQPNPGGSGYISIAQYVVTVPAPVLFASIGFASAVGGPVIMLMDAFTGSAGPAPTGEGIVSWLEVPMAATPLFNASPIPPMQICLDSNSHAAGMFYGPLAPLPRSGN